MDPEALSDEVGSARRRHGCGGLRAGAWVLAIATAAALVAADGAGAAAGLTAPREVVPDVTRIPRSTPARAAGPVRWDSCRSCRCTAAIGRAAPT